MVDVMRPSNLLMFGESGWCLTVIEVDDICSSSNKQKSVPVSAQGICLTIVDVDYQLLENLLL